LIRKISSWWQKRQEWNKWLEERNLKHKKNSPITGTFLKMQFEKERGELNGNYS